jgi:hypothetical protein
MFNKQKKETVLIHVVQEETGAVRTYINDEEIKRFNSINKDQIIQVLRSSILLFGGKIE